MIANAEAMSRMTNHILYLHVKFYLNITQQQHRKTHEMNMLEVLYSRLKWKLILEIFNFFCIGFETIKKLINQYESISIIVVRFTKN